jgi:hypothetical protein
MKRLVCMICGCCLLVSAFAQVPALSITTGKTTSLVFPFAIRHVDRGSKDILVQPVKEADNILLVKAASKTISETNLSVITEDGSVYSMVITYSVNPDSWVYYLPMNQKASLSTHANAILDNQRTMHGIHDKSWDMVSQITGIYIKENVIYYQLKITNKSPVDYEIDLLRFYIKDKKRGKRTASQENELKPLYITGNTKQVKANNQSVIVIALDKFTIPDAKYLAVQIIEKNGGRHMFMEVNNRKIMQAVPLPDLK